MMRWGRMAAAACVGMLCLLLFSCLIHGSDVPTAEPEQQLPMTAALVMQRCVMPVENAAPTADQRVQERDTAVADVLHEAAAPIPVEDCDGNGWIITGRTWPRTVYAVCPPEGMPG